MSAPADLLARALSELANTPTAAPRVFTPQPKTLDWRLQRAKAVIELRQQGKTYEQIAVESCISVPTVAKICRAAGLNRLLTVRPRGVPSPDQEAIVTRYCNGETLQQIGESLGITRERVRQLIYRWEARTGQKVPRRARERSTPINTCINCGSLKPTDRGFCSRRCAKAMQARRCAEKNRERAINIVKRLLNGETWRALEMDYGVSCSVVQHRAYQGLILIGATAADVEKVYPRGASKFPEKYRRLFLDPPASGPVTPQEDQPAPSANGLASNTAER